jgi:PleD family two-component response regulator
MFMLESAASIPAARGISSMTRGIVPMPVVLVVDDEPLIRWSLSERLIEDGYPVRQASNGAEALAVLATLDGQPAIVLRISACPTSRTSRCSGRSARSGRRCP